MSKVDVQAKQREANAARDQFMSTWHEVQHRLSPKTIANDVKEKAREKADGAMSAAKDGVAHAATHPSTIAAVTIPLFVFLFRKPIARGLHKLRSNGAAHEVEDQTVQPYEAARAPAPLPSEPIKAPARATEVQGA